MNSKHFLFLVIKTWLRYRYFDNHSLSVVMAEKEGYKYYPVEVDLDKLYDWKKRDDEDGKNGVKVRVNNKDIAVFKFGDGVIATDAVCPHAGGALHAGEIEELGDSLCVKCPVHKWTFSLTAGTEHKPGACVWPPSAGKQGHAVNIYPTLSDKQSKTIKIAFQEG